MTVKNVDYKQEPIKIPFNFQWGLFLQMLVGEHRAIFGKLQWVFDHKFIFQK